MNTALSYTKENNTKKIDENQKITLTFGQLKKLVREARSGTWVIRNVKLGRYMKETSDGGYAWTRDPNKADTFTSEDDANDYIYKQSHYGNVGAENWEPVSLDD